MTSEQSLIAALETALTSHEYNDVTGTVTVNVTDGLFAIAVAINRLAAVQEQIAANNERSAAEAMSMNRHERRRLGKINRVKIPSIKNIRKVARPADEPKP